MRQVILRRFFLALRPSFLFAVLAVSFGCGFHEAAIPSVTPLTASVIAFTQQQFSVKPLLGGTVWSVNGIAGEI